MADRDRLFMFVDQPEGKARSRLSWLKRKIMPARTAWDRLNMLLEGLELVGKKGLELGPLTNPMVSKPEAGITYVDHVDAWTLP